MANLAWTPWHQVVRIRDELRTDELSLAAFAADLYDVAMQKGRRRLYEDPAQFFALTYPTYNLRELAREVVLRLAGQNEKAVRQLELTYGGGKTHALIALYHLANDPAHLPAIPTVQEFIQHIGMTPPQARVAVLAFDKLDVEKGMEVRGPAGEVRWLKQPWSVLAFQLGGADGLRMLHADGLDAERESAPAENLLVDLLALPGQNGLATLILIDEVLMYAREKIALAAVWRTRIANFFQYLTQAATKVDHCALVASLLATDPRKSDKLGKEITQELYAIFRREREEGVQPVLKEDVAEVLRRRFFTPESLENREAFRPHVLAALKGIAALDPQVAKEGKKAEERFLQNYPFHPDLTDVLYSKWTALEGFQRTRGVLRTFALALRDAEAWDTSPLVGVNAFLGAPGEADLSEAARELTTIAATEEYEGKRQEWPAILLGELEKAREIQEQYPGLARRELEQAVFATFLHSQPIGQKALTRELMLLLGHGRPDRIEMEKALRRWVEVSWFLDEDVMQETDQELLGAEKPLPRAWRLGSRPNLTQMHHDACRYRVPEEIVGQRLIQEIENLKSLTAGAQGPGARVHKLPQSPSQVEDDGEFHYVVLPPAAACEPGKPSELARRFLDEKTGPDNPRVFRNAVVMVAPSPSGLEQARQSIVAYLGWEEVRSQLQQQKLADSDPLRWQMLLTRLEAARKAIAGAVRQAYAIVVTVSEKNEVEAFKVTIVGEPLFYTVKGDARSRIQETAISAEALLPGGPYDLWREGETARWLKDLLGAFAQHPHLPKMLNRQAILDTLVQGCLEGAFVFRLRRPDGSVRTFWRYEPEDAILKEPGLEVVLPEAASLTKLSSSLLAPDVLPGLWSAPKISLGACHEYFGGGHVVQVEKGGYQEAVIIPAAPIGVVNEAVEEAIRSGKLWLLSGPASIWCEEVPAGLLSPDAKLSGPPKAISPAALVPGSLSEAWSGETTTAIAITAALSSRAGETLPWVIVRKALEDAFRSNYLERTLDSGPWPCELPGAQNVKVRVPSTPPKVITPVKPGARIAEAKLKTHELQDLADAAGELGKATAGYELRFSVRIELSGDPPEEVVKKANEVLEGVSGALSLH